MASLIQRWFERIFSVPKPSTAEHAPATRKSVSVGEERIEARPVEKGEAAQIAATAQGGEKELGEAVKNWDWERGRNRQNAQRDVEYYCPPEGVRDLADDQEIDREMRVVNRPRLRSLGRNLKVAGNLVIGGAGEKQTSREQRRIAIESLPEGLRVLGRLELRSCFRLRRLPKDFAVGGSMVLVDCDALKELPAGLKVAGSLVIIGGKALKALPSGLEVEGDFQLEGTRVRELPGDMRIGGTLWIGGRSRIEKLPEGMKVARDLVLRHSRLKELPAGLKVGRDLIVRGSRSLKTTPEGMEVGRHIDFTSCTGLEEVKKCAVGGGVRLMGCTGLRRLPEAFRVNGALSLRGCTSMTALSPKMSVGQALQTPTYLHQSYALELRAWDGSRRRGVMAALDIGGCTGLRALPEDLQVFGPTDVARSGLQDWPPHLAKQRVLWRGVLVPPDVVFHPERLSPEVILKERNAELRRVMLERVGVEETLKRAGAVTVDVDRDAGGERRLVETPVDKMRYLLCRCPSTGRVYLLCVPPGTLHCRAAAAWLAGFDDWERYQPEVET
jgi:hypothetical protein